jgi:hypothetical protein
MDDERTYIYKLWTRRAMQTPCLPFGLLSLRDRMPNSFPCRSFFPAIP